MNFIAELIAHRTPSAHPPRSLGRVPRRKTAFRAQVDRLEERSLLSLTPIGPETLVNTTTAGAQGFFTSVSGERQVNSVAADANGNYVVAWEGNGIGDSYGVFAQRFLADGTPQGPEFRVNTTVVGNQSGPLVAMADDGEFAVAWATPNPGTTSNRPGVIARVFNANGTPRTGEIQVTSFSKNDGNFPSGMAMDADGDFVVAIRGWTGDFGGFPGPNYNGGLVKFQRVNASGQLQGKLTQVFDSDISNISASVAMDAGGNFVVAWSDFSQQAQRYDSAGRKLGSVIHTGLSGNPSIARSDTGAFVIVGSKTAQFYDTNGVAQGSAFTFVAPEDPSVVLVTRAGVSLDPQGNALITWGLNGDVFARRFSPAGTPLEDAVVVNTTTSGPQGDASIAATTASGDFVVVWDGEGPGDDSGVFAQRFTTATVPAPPAPTAGPVILLDVSDIGTLAVPTADLAGGLFTGRPRRAGR